MLVNLFILLIYLLKNYPVFSVFQDSSSSSPVPIIQGKYKKHIKTYIFPLIIYYKGVFGDCFQIPDLIGFTRQYICMYTASFN